MASDLMAKVREMNNACNLRELRYNPAGMQGGARRDAMSLAERRGADRSSCRLEVQCAGADSLFRGTLLNLSATGGYLETATPPAEGATLTLLWNAGQKRVQAEAVVVWSHESGAVGLRFAEPLGSNVLRESKG
jgi:hypothetical protein